MITIKRFRRIEAAVIASGFFENIAWSENVPAPADADALACEAIYVICNSGMLTQTAIIIYDRVMDVLGRHGRVGIVFRHRKKVAAIKFIWRHRVQLFDEFAIAEDKLAFCRGLPFIGPVTQYHLAKNLGVDTAKPDLHLARLAERDGLDPHVLCARIAAKTGYRVATVDTILWRACVEGLINSRVYEKQGWRAATKALRKASRHP